MPSEPKFVVNTEPQLSISITSSKSSSVTSAPLHDLAIFKLFGKLKISYITDYLNKQYNGNWTGKEMVWVWRKLRQEHEKRNSAQAGEVLHLWIDEYRAAVPGSQQRKNYDQTINDALGRFYGAMESEINDSSYEADIELDYKADGRVRDLSTAPEGIGASEATTSGYDKSKYTGKELQEQWLARHVMDNAFNDDLTKWLVASARGDKDIGPNPSKLDPVTGEPTPKYHYVAPPPENIETGLAE